MDSKTREGEEHTDRVALLRESKSNLEAPRAAVRALTERSKSMERKMLNSNLIAAKAEAKLQAGRGATKKKAEATDINQEETTDTKKEDTDSKESDSDDTESGDTEGENTEDEDMESDGIKVEDIRVESVNIKREED